MRAAYGRLRLAGLTALTSLNLSGCGQLTDVSVLAGLTALTSLDLSGCGQLTDVSVLAGLTALTSLDLSGCGQLTDVSVLAGLTALTSLNLSGCEQLTDVSGLAGLTALTSLDLSGCEQLTDVSVLAGLTALTSLNLSGCKQLTDVSVLAGLTALTSLNLSGCEQLTDVSVLAGLTALTSLNLSGCEQLTDVSVLAGLTALTSLNLMRARTFGCGYAQLKAFAPIRPLLDHLTTLTLNGCLFNDLDPALCGAQDENVLHKVRAHFADAEFRAVDDAELKLFLLGNGGVGKTQLCRRLCGLDFDGSIDSTHGVEVNRFSLSLATKQTVHLNIWDFGGQDVYHGTHALFLQKHALYVILWRPEMEAGTVNDHGLVMRNRPLAYWLDFVRSVAGTEAPVLIVQSQFDDANAVPATIAAEHSDFLRARVVQASAKEDDGLERLLPELKRSVKYLLEKRPILSIGAGRVRVRDRLRKWLAADQAKPAKQQKNRTLSWKRFVKLCEKGDGDVSSPEALADFLHNTGFFIYDPKLFHGEIILDQGWALEAIYAVLHRDHCVRRLRQQGGRFTREDLGYWLWDREGHSIADQERFISMMIGCGICFRMRKLSDEGEWPEVWEYAAPDHLPTLAEFQRLYPNIELPDPQTARVAVKVDFRFLHDGLLRSLLVRLGEVGKSAADYWRYGCYFRNQESDIRIRFDSATTPDGPSAAGNITFSAWGEQGRELLERLLEEVQRLSPGQRVQPEWSSQEAGDTLRPGSAGLGPSAPDPRRPSRKAREGLLDRGAAGQSCRRQAASSGPPLPESVRLIDALSDLTEGNEILNPEGLIMSRRPPENATDIVILTALDEERDAVLRYLDSPQEVKVKERISYHAKMGGRDVVLLSMHGMGNTRAAAITQQAIGVWNPKTIFLLGIAGGIPKPEERLLGDLLIPDLLVQYDYGKATPVGLERRFEPYRLSLDWLNLAHAMKPAEWVHRIQVPRPDGTTGRVLPAVHFGTVMSGNQVVTDPMLVGELQQVWPQMVGVEMEGIGVALAAYHAESRPEVFVVKAISDWADPAKGNSCARTRPRLRQRSP